QSRWLHARAARLPRLGPDLVREREARGRAVEGCHQPAFVQPVPRQRTALEHAGVPEGLFVQSGRADGPAERVPGLVTVRGSWFDASFVVRRLPTNVERRTTNAPV